MTTIGHNRQSRGPARGGFSPVTIALLLLLFTTVLYARTLQYSFISDDFDQIVINARVQSWHNLPGFFSQHLWAHQLSAAQGNYYRPLLLVWMLVNYTLFGGNPVGWHATSLLLQMMAGFLVWRTARALTADDSVAIIATAIFLLHPLAIESTVAISDANDPLCLAFLLASFLAFLQRSHWRAWLATAASLALFALALLTKEIAIGFCAFIFLYAALFPPERLRGDALLSAVRTAIPYAGLTALYLVLRRIVVGATVLHAKPVVSVATFLLTLPSVVWAYLQHFFLPANLALYYDIPYVRHAGSRQFWLPTLALLIFAGLIYLAWKRTRSRVFLLGMSWALLLLAPSLYGIAFFGNLGLVHDRYFYPAMAGLGISAAVLIAPTLRRKPAAVAGAVVAVALCVLTFQQQPHWKDNEALFSRAVQVAPGSPNPALVLAGIRLGQGRTEEATGLANKAFALDPNGFPSLMFRASLADQRGDTAQAERSLAAAIAVRPDRAEPHAALAQLRFRQSRDLEGFAEFNKAIELFPNNFNYRLELGGAYLQRNDIASAISQYTAALLLAPEEAELRRAIAILERLQARRPEKPNRAGRGRSRSVSSIHHD
ncbi:MAG: glycosyltransferase family 39 protein [Acidobacteriia bacterium]|nr:glycosyltransferase family 39 protein [Terriglobia bacterium]